MMFPRLTQTALALIFALCGLTSPFAVSAADSNQPIGIEADFAEFNRDKGITIYNGHVVIEQGSRRFWADKVHIYTNDKDQLEKIIALGNPARFRHDQQQQGSGEAFAEADRIEFLASNDQLILLRDAKVWRGNDSIVSERIVYDTETGKVRTGDDKPAKTQTASKSPAKPKSRVRMTFAPSSK
ncbi:MAG: lipopolysaccharide transport periplasmic protein LptA [Gammaproteobacteria bacterium]